jgi:hypothetical protein
MNVQTSKSDVETSEKSSNNSQVREDLEAHEDILKSSSSSLSNVSITTSLGRHNQELCFD